MRHEHSSFIKTPKQLVIVVVLAFAVPIAFFVLVSQLIMGSKPAGTEDTESAVLARIKPVGEVNVAAAGGPKGNMTGEEVFQAVCKTCHEAGIAGAHKFGDKAAWAKVIAQGPALTFQHAIAGIRAMPPKGGNADLSDAEVQRGVVYMVNKAGANWKEPAAPAAPAAETKIAAASAPTAASPSVAPAATAAAGGKPAGAPAAATAPSAAAPAAAAAAGSKTDSKKIYDTVCGACHTAGVAGAPKFGDKAAWAPRLKTGAEALYASVIKGKNAMPPRAGSQLSDAELKAAADYMIAAAK